MRQSFHRQQPIIGADGCEIRCAPACRTGNAILASTSRSDSNRFIRKLEVIFDLCGDERQALERLPVRIMTIKAGQDLVREGDSPSRCALLLSGFACTYKVTRTGRRQIVAFGIPGDIADLRLS